MSLANVDTNVVGEDSKGDQNDDQEDKNVIKPAYSMTDMFDALSDEEDIFLEAEDGTTKKECKSVPQEDTPLEKTLKPDQDDLNISTQLKISNKQTIGKENDDGADHSQTNTEDQVTEAKEQINTDGNDDSKVGCPRGDTGIQFEENKIYVSGDDLSKEILSPDESNGTLKNNKDYASDNQPLAQAKLKSDISGRFHVDGVKYENGDNQSASDRLKDHHDNKSIDHPTDHVPLDQAIERQNSGLSSTSSAGEPNYENVYDDNPENQLPKEQQDSNVTGEPKKSDCIHAVVKSDSCGARNSKIVTQNSSVITIKDCTLKNSAPITTASTTVACTFSVSPSIADRIASLNTKTSDKAFNVTNIPSKCVSVTAPISNTISIFGGGLDGNGNGEGKFNSQKKELDKGATKSVKYDHKGKGIKTDNLKMDHELKEDNLDGPQATKSIDNSFYLDDSISNKSFKIEAVAGTDPSANLKPVREDNKKENSQELPKFYQNVRKKLVRFDEIGDNSKEYTEMIDNDVYGFEDDEGSVCLQKALLDCAKENMSAHQSSQQLDAWVPVTSNISQFKEHANFQQMWQDNRDSTREIEESVHYEGFTELDINDHDQTGGKIESGFSQTGQLSVLTGEKAQVEHENFQESSYELHDPNIPWRSKMVLQLREDNHHGTVDSHAKFEGLTFTVPNEKSEDSNSLPRDLIYENVNYINEGSYGGNGEDGSCEYVDDYDDGGWSSSEFESYENSPANTLEASGVSGKSHSIRRKKERSGSHHHKQGGIRTSFKSPRSSDIQQMITRLGDRIGDKIDKVGYRLSKQDNEEAEIEEDDPVLMEISLNMERHPPAELPTMPYGLNDLQVKRRHIISSIVESETSYLDSLKRIVDDYEKPLQNAKPHILQKETIRLMFHKVKDILQCHHMFHIELSEAVKTWDKDEKIGNVFIASFSKVMVFESYSAYVNNFSVAMETTKKQARSRPAFAEFLKQNLEESKDKLSLFGLMVKPVQRFPQFIMLLQDLLKHTPPDHHDRINLQMALTELENLTHKLNETKRESESRYDAKKIIANTVGRNSMKNDEKRYLVRHEEVLYLDLANGECKAKKRRVYLMSDIILCVSVDHKDSDGTEKYKYKWHLPVEPVEVGDPSVAPSYQVKSGQGKTIVTPIKADSAAALLNPNNPHKQEVDDMLHDLPIIEQVGQLIGQLRMKYEGLNCNVLNGLMRSLQVNIQQKSDVDKCIIQLTLPSSKGQEQKKYTFQLETSNRRRDWLFELQNTKMSLEPKNKPGWLIPENERKFNTKMPLFMKPLLIDVTQHDTRVECAVPVVLPSPELPGVGVQHLWVCSGDRGRGHVTIVSLHGNQPQVVESFKSCDSPILCAELVPGYACCDDPRAFAQDTVWMALENQSLHVRSVSEEHREEPLLSIPVDSQVMCIKYLDSRLYIGLKSGNLMIYSRDQDGIWQVNCKEVLKLDTEPVTDLLPVDHNVWVACGRTVIVLSVTSHYRPKGVTLQIQKTSHSISHAGETFVQSVIKAGAGLVVSFRGSSLLRLYHQETMQHLQDVNVASVLNELIDAKKKLAKDMRESFRKLHVTCLMSCKGLLWIGTSVGCVLTLPLPRLEGVPQIKGRPSVSYHAHVGPIKFLSSIYCGANQLHKPEIEESTVSDIYQQSECSAPGGSSRVQSPEQNGITLGGVTESETDDYRGFTQSAEMPGPPRALDDFGLPGGTGLLGAGLAGSKNFWVSTPDLRVRQAIGQKEDIHTLYGSLLRIPHEDYDAELLGMKHKSNKKGAIPGLSMVTKKATAVNARFKQMMAESSSSPQSKYATLPVLLEDCPASDTSNKTSVVDSESTSSTSDIDNFLNMQSSQDNASNSVPTCHPPSSSQQVLGGESERKNNAKHNESHHHNKPLFISQSAPVAMLNNSVLGKSHMVVSGGEGHINWSEAKPLEMKYEDLCLLLWQYRQ